MTAGTQRALQAAHAGGARAQFIDRVRQALAQCRRGGSAAACVADVERALAALDARAPQNTNRAAGLPGGRK